MNNNRTAAAQASDLDGSTPSAWTRFWLTPISPLGLRCLRFLAGLLFFVWLASFLGHQAEFFSLNGWLDLKAVAEMQRETQRAQLQGQPNPAPPIGWSILFLAGDNFRAFEAIYFGSLIVLALFALGVATRLTAPLTWVIVVSFIANPATSYDGEHLLGILAFYLMIGHLLLGQWSGNLSPLERLLGSRNDFLFATWLWPAPGDSPGAKYFSYAANLTMRLVQIHVTIIILTSALHKLQIAEWWGGVALWYPLHPTFQTTVEGLRAEALQAPMTLFFLSLIGYGVLVWQLAFPVYAWRGGWCRTLLLGGAALGWAGTFFLFKLPLFGPFVMLGCLSFLRPDEWSWALGRLQALMSGAAVAKKGAEPKKIAVTNIKK